MTVDAVVAAEFRQRGQVEGVARRRPVEHEDVLKDGRLGIGAACRPPHDAGNAAVEAHLQRSQIVADDLQDE